MLQKQQMMLVHGSIRNQTSLAIPNLTHEGLIGGHPDAMATGPLVANDIDSLPLVVPPSMTAPANTIDKPLVIRKKKKVERPIDISDTVQLHASYHSLLIEWPNTTNSAMRTQVLFITPLILVGILCEKQYFPSLMTTI